MAVLTTRYSVGDTVWHANTVTQKFSHPCPDCLGSRTWKCTSPAGGEFEVPCPRCSTNYHGNHKLSLEYAQYVPTAAKRTIGLVRASSEPGAGYHQGNSYMCFETGIGSGSVYSEDELHATEAEALTAAQAAANAQNANAESWVAKQYDETAKFCDYQLRDATMQAAVQAADRIRYDCSYLIEDLDSAVDLTDVRERIASWREKGD